MFCFLVLYVLFSVVCFQVCRMCAICGPSGLGGVFAPSISAVRAIEPLYGGYTGHGLYTLQVYTAGIHVVYKCVVYMWVCMYVYNTA